MAQCTKNKKGRLIERSEYTEYIEANKQQMTQNKEVYRRRQAIVEHPFGIMKRQCGALSLPKWGFDHIMTKKTTKRASADIGLIYCAFNLRRIINLVGKSALKAWLKALTVIFPSNARRFKPNSAPLILSQQTAASKSTLPLAA